MVALAIIGCGTHAHHHAKHMGSMGTVVAAWDPNPKAQKISAPWKFLTLEDLLAHDGIEGVIICSPDQFHLEQIEMALAADMNVFCEKPLLVPGQPIERLEAAFDLAERKNLILTSCHPRRYDRPFVWLNEKLKNGELYDRFGKVVSFDFDFSYHAPETAWKHGRSLLLDHINHEVDIMNSFFGIQGFDAWKLGDGHDYYDVVGKRDDGITFHFKGTRRLEQHFYHEWCRIRFERGEVELDMMNGWARISDHGGKTVEIIEGLSIDYEGRLEKVMYDFAHTQIYCRQDGYLSRPEMLMNTEAGIVLGQSEGVQRINIRT